MTEPAQLRAGRGHRARRHRRRRGDDRQHGAAAPVHARRPAPRRRAERRERHEGHAAHRLSPHGLGEDDGEHDVLQGPHHHRPRGLSFEPDEQPRLLDGRREADGHRGSPARPAPAPHPQRVRAHRLPPALARHPRAGHRRDDPVLLHLARARRDPGPQRDDVRRPHDDELDLPRRPARRHARGLVPQGQQVRGELPPAAGRVQQAGLQEPDLGGAAVRRRRHLGRGRHRVGPERAEPARLRRRLGHPQGEPLLRLRAVRL